jgi:endonuclease YncB( thermonuclease family)
MEVIDGDTVVIRNGLSFRLVGIDAPNREEGEDKYSEAKKWLEEEIGGKEVNLEYDRYIDEKFGRLTGYVWIDCEEKEPKFEAWDYMKKNKSESMPELTINPLGCQKGTMVNEEAIRAGIAKFEIYEGRGKLKYQNRLKEAQRVL